MAELSRSSCTAMDIQCNWDEVLGKETCAMEKLLPVPVFP